MGKPVALATKDRMAANGKDQDLIDYYAFGNAEVDVAEDFEDIKKEKVYQVLMGARVEEYQEILKGVRELRLRHGGIEQLTSYRSMQEKEQGLRKC